MLNSRKVKKFTAISVILSILISLLPVSWAGQAEAAGAGDQKVYVGLSVVGNASNEAENALVNFNNNREAGFKVKSNDAMQINWDNGDILNTNKKGGSVEFQLNVADNPTLKNMALSGHTELVVGWRYLNYDSGWTWGSSVSGASVTLDGKVILIDGSHNNNESAKSATAVIGPNSVITIGVSGEDSGGEVPGAYGFYIKFQDKQRPVLNSYTFTGNGAERLNTNINQQELFVKRDENITLSYNFSEPVYPATLTASNADYFLQHKLFMNDPDTLLPAAGDQQYLTNITYTKSNLSSLYNQISYRYTGVPFHNSGNLPLQPLITGGTSGAAQMDLSLENKFLTSELRDAAGNLATVNFNNLPSSASSNEWLSEDKKRVNPFDFENGGFRVIVDAVRPKYSKTANGIQPEILTGVTLNKGDVIDFTLQMTEEAIVKTGWEVKNTYILFNNGMKAYYVAGSNTKNWTFRMTVPDGITVETPLLKAIAISNDAKTGNEVDKNVIQDYAGNLLIQPANFDGTYEDETPPYGSDISLVNSKIDWANLFIDNTKPLISYRYETGGASGTTYQKKGKVTIDANDPSIKVPYMDPDLKDPSEERPSRGIYRPSNMSAEASPSVGLVYYMWSQDKADPLAGDKNFAALKRYSLAAKQPSDQLYPGKYQDVQLQVVNNKTNLLSPPPEAFSSENSGEWYLHTWTADMTWDSARELMQYEKMEDYVAGHQAQYDAWFAEAAGSKADKEFYANNKALAAVGQYDDLDVWPLEDFMHDDSNWTHEVGVLKLDNQVPSITLAATDNKSTVQALVQDPHSGIQSVQYQWVKNDGAPADVEWKPANYSGTTVTQSAYDDIDEDGAYWLYLKALDKAGNEVVKTPMEEPLNVSSQESMPTAFTPEANPEYVKSHDVIFEIGGTKPEYVGYVISGSSLRPADGAFKPLDAMQIDAAPAGLNSAETEDAVSVPEEAAQPEVTAEVGPVAILKLLSSGALENNLTSLQPLDTEEPVEGGATPEAAAAPEGTAVPETSAAAPAEPGSEPEAGPEAAAKAQAVTATAATYGYVIPADTSFSGTQYIHLMVKHSDKTYYYSKAYYFDNEAPAVTFSINEVAYPLAEQDTTVKVSEFYSKNNVKSYYQWVKEGETAPTEVSGGWQDLPASGLAEISGKGLKPGEIADYRLYVHAIDGAGNSIVTSTAGIFKVSASGDKDAPPADAQSSLVYLSGDEEDGYTAILKLSLETEDKSGYEYSVSPDNGASWQNWRPYTNFVAVKVPSGDPDALQVQVKYRTPGGKISDAAKLEFDAEALEDQPVYALATQGTSGPVTAAAGADIDIALPAGIRVQPSKINPAEPTRTGNRFNVQENGFYSFDLTDMADKSRTDTLYVVVKNIDKTIPQGTVEYSNAAFTNGNVTAYLQKTSEPVVITNNGGKNAYTFKENGSFTFEFKDAAGNPGSVTATVNNIDKEAPAVKVVRSYEFSKDKPFGTIKDAGGNVIYSTGVALTVEKADGSAKDIVLISGKQTVMLTENGTVSFTVADKFGNTTVVKEKVDNIVTAVAQPEEIVYTFVDEDGKEVPADKIVTIDGQKYAKGKVKVTLSGKIAAPNKLFSGVKPIESGAGFTNQISNADGTFSYSRVFENSGSTVMSISDLLGNVNKVPVTISGIDNTAPELTLNKASVGIAQNKKDFNFATDLGGYTVTDNVSKSGNIKVSVEGLDLTKLGRQKVTYTAVDQVGNVTVAYQDVVVVKDGGLLIFGDDTLISASSGESALFNTNTITFKVSGYNLMNVGGTEKVNQAGTFDILYYSGLFREGQMKVLQQKLTYDQLVSSQFKVTFPKTGWYTIIVRTQERDREFATFFVGSVK
ncbi:hypothetical protein [Paenibacillus tengchongensis]|uniref:hypothetical protein n=1 Tax=Paenibacillus tengchongensis TaxID=2608684 RepID=UPI00124E5BFD|nr:hypothetical protein [Paenibacillus tengchongensis]